MSRFVALCPGNTTTAYLLSSDSQAVDELKNQGKIDLTETPMLEVDTALLSAPTEGNTERDSVLDFLVTESFYNVPWQQAYAAKMAQFAISEADVLQRRERREALLATRARDVAKQISDERRINQRHIILRVGFVKRRPWEFLLSAIVTVTVMWLIYGPRVQHLHDNSAVLLILVLAVIVSLGGKYLEYAFKGQIDLSERGVESRFVKENESLEYAKIYPWSRLYSVSLDQAKPNKLLSFIGLFSKRESAHLRFESGEDVVVPIDLLSEADRREFFIALDRWAAPFCLAPEILKLGQKMFGNSALAEAPTFTQYWEEELRSRFSATTFQTLSANTKLQDGRYEVQRTVGCGGFSAAYLARDKGSTRKAVVLKETVISDNFEPLERERLLKTLAREAALLAKLDHPNINKVFDHFVENQRHYLVLEFVDGVSLRHQIQEGGKQSEAQALAWSAQIADVLSYLHGCTPAIIHRDVTPDNIVVTPGRAVLVDFGSAKELVGNATSTVIGKQAYIPPEQFRGKATPLSDVYALARCVYFALTGQDAEALTEIDLNASEGTCSEKLCSLIVMSTSLDETQRPSAAAFAKELVNISSSESHG